MAPKLGIVAGGGELPALLISACHAAGRSYFVLAIEGHAEPECLAGEPQAWIRLGEGGKGIELLRDAGVEDLVFAGAVRRPGLAELRPDKKTAKLLARVGRAWAGDNALLGAVISEVENEGFRVVAPHSLLTDCLATEGAYGTETPDDGARADIERGITVLRAIGALDIGQAAIVQQGVVLGIEGAEGTDALIERCKTLHRPGPGGVLVKIPKPGQERRVDLPAIGVTTVALAARSGLRGIAVEAGGALVFGAEAIARDADRVKIFVVGVAVPE
jgi:DUF1009 family protein